MERALRFGVASTLAAAAVVGLTAGCSSEQGPGSVQSQQLERPLPMPGGVLNLSDPTIRQDLNVLPDAVRNEEAGVVQIKDSEPNPSDDIEGSAFIVAKGAGKYAITANHVVNANVSAITPVACNETHIYSTFDGGESGMSVANHTTRPESFVMTAPGKYAAMSIMSSQDLGAYELESGITADNQPTLPVQQTDGVLKPGTVLYNTNWQPETSGAAAFPNIAEGAKPDVIEGIVLGEVQPWSGDSDQGYYAVLTDVKGFAAGQAIINKPGASGSPWETADGTVRAVSSSVRNVPAKGSGGVPVTAIESAFGIDVKGATVGAMADVTFVQEVSQQDIDGMVTTMGQQNACN